MPDRRLFSRRAVDSEPVLSFGAWRDLTSDVLAVCHPEWRGVRTSAFAFRDPVVETRDAGRHAEEIVEGALAAGVTTIVVHGFPPGTDTLLQASHRARLTTRVVVHSSMAQHGAEAGEAAVMDAIVRLAAAGVVNRIGFVKAGLAEVFRALGTDAHHTPNRTPVMPHLTQIALDGASPHIGVFGALYWRKNVVTQLGAAAIMGGTAHVMTKPAVAYLDRIAIVEHGELDRDRFLAVQASTNVNLYVTLSECHPMGPMESYLSGVPALVSRTSDLFWSDAALFDVTTTEWADDPHAIAQAANRLLTDSSVVVRAQEWLGKADKVAEKRWAEFVASGRK